MAYSKDQIARNLRVDEHGRQCSTCEEYKPRSGYYKMARGAFGMSAECKDCKNAKSKAKRDAKAALKPRKRVDEFGKECPNCKEYKLYTDYWKSKHTSDGYTTSCSTCMKTRSAKWREENPDIAKILTNAWVEKNIDYVRDRARDYATTRRAEIGLEEYSRLEKQYRLDNPERWVKYNKNNYAKNRVALREKSRLDRINRPEAHAAYDATKRAKRKNAQCAWADQDAIKAIYKLAQMLTKCSNSVFHVDHIVPLVSDVVQGLHVESNLRIVLAKDNLLKSNKFDPWTFDPNEIPSIHHEDLLKMDARELRIFGDMVGRDIFMSHVGRLRDALMLGR